MGIAENLGDGGNVAVVRKKSKKGAGAAGAGAKKKSFGLSFGDDVEEENAAAPAIKTSLDSRRLRRPDATAVSAPPETLDQASISTLAASRPTYNAEYLASLKASTATRPPTEHSGATTGLAGEGYDALTQSKFATYVPAESETSIPTTSHIASIKEKRRALQASGVSSSAAEYISLDVARPVVPGLHGESRLVREEDELGEGDDDVAEYTGANERVALGRKARRRAEESRRRGIEEMILDAEEDGEEDEEMRVWEEEQARRGGEHGRREEGRMGWEPLPIPEQQEVISVQAVMDRLNGQLGKYQDEEKELAKNLEKLDIERKGLSEQEEHVRAEVERVEGKKEWFDSFKEYIDDLASFLDVKYPILEKIEKDNLSIQSERSSMIRKRRFQDMSDCVAHFTNAEVAVVPPKLKKRKVSPTNGVSNGDDASSSSSESDGADDDKMEVDELGRERREKDTRPDSLARQNRRIAKQKRLEAFRSQGGTEEEGFWSDNELPSGDSRDLVSAGEDIQSRLAEVFEDVKAKEFRDPDYEKGVRGKFEEWRARFGEDYDRAWGDLGLAGVWEFWVRWEMGGWNVFDVEELRKTSNNLDAYKWQESLLRYSHGGTKENDEIISTVLKTIIIPKLLLFAREVYDPHSLRATKRAINVVDEVASGLLQADIEAQTLTMEFLLQFSKEVAALQFLVLPHARLISSPSILLDPSRFSSRIVLLRSSLKLATNALLWKRHARNLRLPVDVEELGGVGRGMNLQQLLGKELLEKVVAPVLEAAWDSGGREVWNASKSRFEGVMVPKRILDLGA
ncbi:hypothetical protein BT69DRAFT_1329362 [Atractiella rhizophila]|nr:hypothetical protein BT69DRAFT_1329362 [Atractiella rhizophila]